MLELDKAIKKHMLFQLLLTKCSFDPPGQFRKESAGLPTVAQMRVDMLVRVVSLEMGTPIT